MFDDVCLVCGKFVADNVAYCSALCEASDTPELELDPDSPALSSSFTSPYASSSTTDVELNLDIPPLMLDGKDSSDGDLFLLSTYETTATDAVPVHNPQQKSLAFNRRPSPVDTRALAPVLRRSSHSHSHSQSKPKVSPSPKLSATPTPTPSSLLQKRTRASLPAYFSRLQLGANTHAPPSLSLNTHVNIKTESHDTPTPTPKRRHSDSEPQPEVYAPVRTPRSRSRSGSQRGYPVPGVRREREQEREDVERRGRSRVRVLREREP